VDYLKPGNGFHVVLKLSTWAKRPKLKRNDFFVRRSLFHYDLERWAVGIA